MTNMNSKVWRIMRWILLLPVALSTFFLISFLVGPLLEHKWYAVIKWALATAGSIYISSAIAPSPRVAISVVALVTILLLPFLDFIYSLLELYWGLGKIDDSGDELPLDLPLWLVGLALGVILSTTKGLERAGVIRSLRWTLFVPIAVSVASGEMGILKWLNNTISLSSKLSHYHAAVLMGVQNTIFISVGGLIAPSHRAAITLLNASLSFIGVVFGLLFMHSDLFLKIDKAPDLLESAPVTICLIAWAIGTIVGSIVALRSATLFKKTSSPVPDTIEKNRRYKGTAPYQDIDLDRKTFFGRDHESRSLLNLVMAERLVVLFAKSGMGKSSLINTALVEQLRKLRYFPIVVRLNNQGPNPMYSLLASVQYAAKEASVDILGYDGTSAWRLFKTAEFWSENNDLLRPVLILDQFEEIFTLHSPAVRHEFIGQLGELIRGRSGALHSDENGTAMGEPLDNSPPPHLKILISLREDYLANLEELAQEIPAILHNRFRLGPLSREAARQAIIEPARLAEDSFQTDRFTYQEEAVQKIVVFLAKRRFGDEITKSDEVEPVQLQLICHYLEEMVRQRQASAIKGGEIKLSEVDLGGEEQMKQIMEGFYDRTIATVKPHHKACLVQRLCEKRLVSSGGRRLTEDHDEIKRCFKLSDKILWQLVDARLLRAEFRLGSTFYEVSHDRLVEPILKSRNKRLAKQRWIAATAILFFLIVGSGLGLLLVDNKAWKSREGKFKFQMLGPDSKNAIRSSNRLIELHKYPPKKLLEKLKPSYLNPAALVVLAVSVKELSVEDKKKVFDYIERYYEASVESEKPDGAPTLLGAMLFILDKLEDSSDRKTIVLSAYKARYSKQNQGSVDDMLNPDSPPDNQKYVTNKEYKRFYQYHKDDDLKPVNVNWFEALAYTAYKEQKLPEKNKKSESEGDCKTAFKFSDMLDDYQSNRWDYLDGNLLNTLIGESQKGEFCIYRHDQN